MDFCATHEIETKKLIESYLYFPCNILNSKTIIAVSYVWQVPSHVF